jgi:hypothetical protein
MQSRDNISEEASGTAVATAPCPKLNGQCVEHGSLGEHWGIPNEVAAIRPHLAVQSLFSAQLFAADAPDVEPTLALSVDGFDGDLSLAEIDQLVAGLRDCADRLQVQAAHLAAAQRLHGAVTR